jgi:hypothetical protein
MCYTKFCRTLSKSNGWMTTTHVWQSLLHESLVTFLQHFTSVISSSQSLTNLDSWVGSNWVQCSHFIWPSFIQVVIYCKSKPMVLPCFNLNTPMQYNFFSFFRHQCRDMEVQHISYKSDNSCLTISTAWELGNISTTFHKCHKF